MSYLDPNILCSKEGPAPGILLAHLLPPSSTSCFFSVDDVAEMLDSGPSLIVANKWDEASNMCALRGMLSEGGGR